MASELDFDELNDLMFDANNNNNNNNNDIINNISNNNNCKHKEIQELPQRKIEEELNIVNATEQEELSIDVSATFAENNDKEVEERENRHRKLSLSNSNEHDRNDNNNRDNEDHHHRHRHHRSHHSRKRHRSKKREKAESEITENKKYLTHKEKAKHSKYVLDTAAEGRDSEEDSFIAEDGEDDVEDGFDEHTAEHVTAPKKFIFHEGEDELTAEELGREYEQRLQDLRSAKRNRGKEATDFRLTAERKGELRQVTSSIRYAAHLLPQESDPKVFAVKCRPRMTRLLVARIVNKCYAYRVGRNFEHKRVDLGIISVFCLDHVKEYIYVEAFRKLFVEHALNGLDGLFRFNITVVDPSELMQMMEHRPSNEKVKVGAFVRLRQRQYRMDLAQVTEVHQDGVHITCKVVPREDFIGKPFNKPLTRLQQRFFVPSLAVGVEKRGELYRWGDLQFDKDGYLLKIISISMTVSGTRMENPSTEELAHFYKNNRERIRAVVAESVSVVSSNLEQAQIGDCVRVTSGQLTGTVGTISNIFANNNTALLSCTVPGQVNTINLRVELRACTRHFSEGMHVIVEKGDHAGESGTVVRAWNETVLLFPDRSSTATELVVRANDCHQSNLVGSFGHSFGVWQLFDLVALSDTNAAACIIRLTRQNVDVLTERNERRTVTYAQIKSISRGFRKTTDRMQNPLVRGSEVIIQRTPSTPFNLCGESGRIEQVFNRTLFINCRGVTDNTGIVALDAGCVLLTGGRTTTKQTLAPRELPAQLRRPHNATMADISASFRSSHPEWASTSEWHELSSIPR